VGVRFTLNTLGAPAWSLEETARNARAYGYAGIDLRLLDGEVITLDAVRAQRRRLRALFPPTELPIAVLATSVRLTAPDAAARRQRADEIGAWVDLAADLGVPVVRVFGGATPTPGSRGDPAWPADFGLEGSCAAAAEVLALAAPRAEQAGVVVGLETHDDFSSAAVVARVLAEAPSPAVGAVWDMFHTTRVGESPAEVLRLVGERLANVHLKDARRTDAGWQLVLLGEGEVPVREGLRLLREHGYAGYVSVEWEKKWHPELAEPEVAYPQHLEVLGRYLRELGPEGRVEAVSRGHEHGVRKSAQGSIRLLAGLGVEGDAHVGRTVQHRSRVARNPAQPNLRQVHLIQAELFDELRPAGFDVSAGQMGENVTTRGVDLLGLPAGARLHLGPSAIVELTGLRNPCHQLDGLQPGLMKATLGRDAEGKPIQRAGVMGVVVAGGEVRPGDPIRVELPPAPHRPLAPV
jgi:sugar phosphate isomerase/epimerase/MOSC domain-containing protein YiiM